MHGPALATATALAALLSALPAAPAAAAPDPEQRFVVVQHSRDGVDQGSTVTASGVVHGHGPHTQQYLGRTPGGETLIRFTWHLPDGTLTAEAVERHVLDVDPRSCTARGSGTGTWRVLEGTGAWAGATGGGTFTAESRLKGARRNGVCQGPGSGVSPHTSNSTVKGTGEVALPDR